MAQPSQEEEKQLITNEANTLLIKLNNSYIILQRMNKDIESRPFSTRIHGQFDRELKKSQKTIGKLSSLLRKYHTFEFSSSLSLEIKSDDDTDQSSKPIDSSFIIEFKDICLKIEREWRIGTKSINDFQSKYGQQEIHSDHYHSDNDNHRHRHRKKNRHHSRSRSGSIGSAHSNRSNSSSPMHSFSNPNSPLFQPQKNNMSQSVTITRNKPNKLSSLNLGASQSQILQQKQIKRKTNIAYHAKIGKDFVPYDEEERLNQQIRDINDDLQYLLDINKQVNDLVDKQAKDVDEMQANVASAADHVQQGHDTLTSIRKSPITYAIMGGITLAALGGPITLLAGVGLKAAVGSAVGLGTVGAYSGTVYAKRSNQAMDADNAKDKEQRLLNEQKEQEQAKQGAHGFRTKPRRRSNGKGRKSKYGDWKYQDMDDDDDDDVDIDTWDARN